MYTDVHTSVQCVEMQKDGGAGWGLCVGSVLSSIVGYVCACAMSCLQRSGSSSGNVGVYCLEVVNSVLAEN